MMVCHLFCLQPVKLSRSLLDSVLLSWCLGVRLKLLKERLIMPGKGCNIPEYMSKLMEGLQMARSLAHDALSSAQVKMKHYDKKSVVRSFQLGDKVLVFLPTPGSALSTKFCGPYVVNGKLSDIMLSRLQTAGEKLECVMLSC